MLQFNLITKAYAPLLAALHAQSFDNPWNESAFKKLLMLPTTIGVVCNAGFVLCSVVMDEAEILTICVIPEQRKKGIASALLKKIMLLLKGKNVKKIFLDVRASNLNALNLYYRHGFIQVDSRKNYYNTLHGKENALILRKEL